MRRQISYVLYWLSREPRMTQAAHRILPGAIFTSILFVALTALSAPTAAETPSLEKHAHKEFLAQQYGAELFTHVRAQIIDDYPFFGLAEYYNQVEFYVFQNDKLSRAEPSQDYLLNETDWFLARGRFKVFALRHEGALVKVSDASFSVTWPNAVPEGQVAAVVPRNDLESLAPELGPLSYTHLGFLGPVAQSMEDAIVWLQTHGVKNWGLAVLLFGTLIKFFLLPVGIASVRLQRRVSKVNAKLLPRLARIKADFKGEEAHNKIMAAHQELGVTPFFTLKPLSTSLIHVPVLVAISSVLGIMPDLAGKSFLWIEDLAYPDALLTLPFSIPLLGDKLSLLPFLMTLVTILCTIYFQDRHATPQQLRAQKKKLYLMSVGFFVLFYPFPAALVLYWTFANMLHSIQQYYVRI